MSTNDVPKNFDSCQVAEWHITLQTFGGPRCQFVNDLSRKDTWQLCMVAMLQGEHRSVRTKNTGHAKWWSVAQTWPIVFFGCNFHEQVFGSQEFRKQWKVLSEARTDGATCQKLKCWCLGNCFWPRISSVLAPTFHNLAWQGITELGEGVSTIENSFLSLLVLQPQLFAQFFFSSCVLGPELSDQYCCGMWSSSATSFHAKFPWLMHAGS